MACVQTYCVRDYASIQAAIDAATAAGGGIVLFAAGTWNITSGLTLKSNVVLQGTSRAGSIIRATGSGITMLYAGAPGNPVTGAGVRNLTVDGNATALVGIQFDGATDCFAEDVHSKTFISGGHCFYMTHGASRNRWQHCVGENGPATSFEIYAAADADSCYDNWVLNCEGKNSSGNMGLEIKRSHRNKVFGGWFHDNNQAGIFLEDGASENIIVGARCNGNGNNGIRLTGIAGDPTRTCSRNVISDCVIASHPTSTGILVYYSTDNCLQSCDVSGSTNGIEFRYESPAASHNRVVGCSAHDNSLIGVYLNGVAQVSVVGGQARNNMQNAIRLDASTYCIISGVDVRSDKPGKASDITEYLGSEDNNTITACQAVTITKRGANTRLVANPGIADQ